MKTQSSNLLILILVGALACSCAQKNGGATEVADATPTNHPKGQASVSDDVSEKNILQVAMSSDAHTTLVAGVEAAQIEHVLVNAGPLTVFAPTNDAFNELPEGTLKNLLKPENKTELATILTRHAAPGSYDMDALKKEAVKGRKLYMATGDYLDIVVEGDVVKVGGATIVGTIPTSNGVVHVVNHVILLN